MKRAAPVSLSAMEPRSVLRSHTRVSSSSVTSGWADIQPPQQAFKARHIQLGQQQPERRVRWRLAEFGAQQLVERLSVALGKAFHPNQRALAAEDRKDGHQQHPPLGKAHAAAHPAIGQRLEEADEIAWNSGRGGGLGGQGASAVPAHNTVGAPPQPGILGQTSKRP